MARISHRERQAEGIVTDHEAALALLAKKRQALPTSAPHLSGLRVTSSLTNHGQISANTIRSPTSGRPSVEIKFGSVPLAFLRISDCRCGNRGISAISAVPLALQLLYTPNSIAS